MKETRVIGNYVQYLAHSKDLSEDDLARLLDCSPDQIYSFFKGRSYASFSQLQKLATLFDTTVADLINGDLERYNSTVVHCMNDFQDPNNREKILDIIDGYIDIVDALDRRNA